jgi:hypothetical protein
MVTPAYSRVSTLAPAAKKAVLISSLGIESSTNNNVEVATNRYSVALFESVTCVYFTDLDSQLGSQYSLAVDAEVAAGVAVARLLFLFLEAPC